MKKKKRCIVKKKKGSKEQKRIGYKKSSFSVNMTSWPLFA